MDWERAIEQNRDALLRIVAALFSMAGLTAGASASVLPRHLKSAIMCVLRPAESAARRLIVVMQCRLNLRDIALKPTANARPAPDFSKFAHTKRTPTFQLFDPLKNFQHKPASKRPSAVPHIRFFGQATQVFETPKPALSADDAVKTAHIFARLNALQTALDDLPKQAKRLARTLARPRKSAASTKRHSPLRPGYAPGARKRHRHPVDAILAECHNLAIHAREAPT